MNKPILTTSGDPVDSQVKQRILDSGEQLFAERGFDGTSVRTITNQAQCNLASVNYHFGGKDKLYVEVFRRQLVHLRQVRIAGIEKVVKTEGASLTIEQLLYAFAHVFLDPLVEPSQGHRFTQLMLRELSDPLLPANLLWEEMFFPVSQVLLKALHQLYPQLDPLVATRCIHSLIGQLVHVVQVRKIFSDQSGEHPVLDLTAMIEHIVRFSAGGFEACYKNGGDHA